MTTPLEEYLTRPRTFKGPIVDYVFKRNELIADFSDAMVHFDEAVAFRKEKMVEYFKRDLKEVK